MKKISLNVQSKLAARIALTIAGLTVFNPVAPTSAQSQQETTVYMQGTLHTDTGKMTGTVGASHSETRGTTTTKVDVNANTNKEVNGSASSTTRR